MLVRHEGLRNFPYKDSVGKWTVGVGRNLEDRGISDEEAMYLLGRDIWRCTSWLKEHFDYFNALNPARQDVVISMVFNMGGLRYLEFRKMIAALMKQDFDAAAVAMLDSVWARQVGARAHELATMMKTGDYFK
jgi:lysozyme